MSLYGFLSGLAKATAYLLSLTAVLMVGVALVGLAVWLHRLQNESHPHR